MSDKSNHNSKPKPKAAVTILHLYPEELNIYGDMGNVATLVKRLEWRGYRVLVQRAGVGQPAPIAGADIIFGGGGQDRGQVVVGRDLQRHSKALHQALKAGTPMLAICGTYQLFGRGFTTLEGEVIPGIGLFAASTFGSEQRMIGNVIIDSPFGQLVGFENHSGRTLLEAGQQSLGRVVQGYGNDGRSGNEGAIANNAIGTYLHGPLLPKNPALADHIIKIALERKFGPTELGPLDDTVELAAAKTAASRDQ